MPPTWTIISFVYINYPVNLLVLTFIGAVSSTFGRFLLAKYSKKSVPLIFSDKAQNNMSFVGNMVDGSGSKVFLVAFLWAISPIASNTLFIGVGFSGAKLLNTLGGFFIGRTISYYFLAYTSKLVYDSFEEIFRGSIISWEKILVTVFGFVLIFIYLCIDWEALYTHRKLKWNLSIFRKRSK